MLTPSLPKGRRGRGAHHDPVTGRGSNQPTVLFAYTMKGWGLPFAGDPLNHSALLSQAQIDALRTELCIPADDDWACFDAQSPEGAL